MTFKFLISTVIALDKITNSNAINLFAFLFFTIIGLFRISNQCFRQTMMLFTLGFLLSSCGGGGPGGTEGKVNDGVVTDTVSKGVFSDSPVGGLTYTINSISKITNKNGEFEYKTGDIVAFSIGHILIGEAVALFDLG